MGYYFTRYKFGSHSYDLELQRQSCKNLQRFIIFLYLKLKRFSLLQRWRCSCKFKSRRIGSRAYIGTNCSVGAIQPSPRLKTALWLTRQICMYAVWRVLYVLLQSGGDKSSWLTDKKRQQKSIVHPRIRVARWYIFKPKILIWIDFGGSGNGRCWYILSPLVYFTAIWYILWSFGIFYNEVVYFPPLHQGKSGNTAKDWPGYNS
jgi:hypothetical protein